MFYIIKQKTRANIPRTIRFYEDLYQRLLKISSSEGISFNSLVLMCCDYALNKYSPSKTIFDNNERK